MPVIDKAKIDSIYRLARKPVGTILETREVLGIECARYLTQDGREVWRVLEPAEPIELVGIELTRAEGPIDLCITKHIKPETRGASPLFPEEGPWRCSALIAANAVMTHWGSTAPKEGQGYDKCDVVLNWADETSWTCRFDLQYGGMDGRHTFIDSMRWRFMFYSGLKRPFHMTEDQYHEYVNADGKYSKDLVLGARHILGKCEL